MGSNLARIIKLIGRDGAERLCRHYGGVSFYIPHTPKESHAWAQIISQPAWEALCGDYGGTRLTLPRGEQGLKRARVLELLNTGGVSVRQIALRTGATERYVSMLRAKMMDTRQAPLPFAGVGQ